MNRVTLMGNIGKEPESFSLPSGDPVTTLTMATSDGYKDKDGKWIDSTDWHNLKGYKAIADKMGLCQKGDKVLLEGRVKQESWEKDGVRKYKTVILVSYLTNLTAQFTKRNASVTEFPPADPTPQAPQANPEDDLPF